MQNYIELAHRTSVPIEAPSKRLEEPHGSAALRDIFVEAATIGGEADNFKRAIFYGKGSVNPRSYCQLDAESVKRSIDPKIVELIHAGVGMLTEACEFLQAIGAHVLDAQPLDETLLKEEIGDSFWYLAKACKFLGTTFEAEQQRNIEKLKARYPERFTEEKAVNRDLQNERKVLEMNDPARRWSLEDGTNRVIYLLTPSELKALPPDTRILSINGDSRKVSEEGEDAPDDDTRFGFTAWGIYPETDRRSATDIEEEDAAIDKTAS